MTDREAAKAKELATRQALGPKLPRSKPAGQRVTLEPSTGTAKRIFGSSKRFL